MPKSSKMHGRSSFKKSNRSLSSHAGDVTEASALCESDTDLFEEVHEARAEAPGLVAVTLQGADGHLSGPLGRDGHHEHRVVHQGRVRLRRSQRRKKMLIRISRHTQNNPRSRTQLHNTVRYSDEKAMQ